jgi:hypothetical protein
MKKQTIEIDQAYECAREGGIAIPRRYDGDGLWTIDKWWIDPHGDVQELLGTRQMHSRGFTHRAADDWREKLDDYARMKRALDRAESAILALFPEARFIALDTRRLNLSQVEELIARAERLLAYVNGESLDGEIPE